MPTLVRGKHGESNHRGATTGELPLEKYDNGNMIAIVTTSSVYGNIRRFFSKHLMYLEISVKSSPIINCIEDHLISRI
jgi:hypothetical protein